MKTIPLLLLGLSLPLFAGTSESVRTSDTMQQAHSPSLHSWFIGLSYGQFSGVDSNAAGLADEAIRFFDGEDGFGGDGLDFDMYALQFGRNWGSGFYGFNTKAYLEVAYMNGDTDVSYDGDLTESEVLELLEIDGLDVDIDIIPITINFLAERNLFGGLGMYIGAGVGYAFTDTDAFGESDTDGGFYAQASAGLSYNFTESFELFAGGRWVYLDCLEFGDSELELDDSLGWEVGARFSF